MVFQWLYPLSLAAPVQAAPRLLVLRLLRILPDDLVQFLPVATAADRVHEDVLGRDERQLLPQMLRHNLVVDRSPGDNVDRQRKDAVGSQESFRYCNSAVRGVVQSAFEPLC